MKFIFVIVILFSLSQYAHSQCSDAGICILGKYHNEMYLGKDFISLSYNYGNSGTSVSLGNTNSIFYHTFKIDGDFRIAKSMRIGFSMPYLIISGPLGDNNGQGDLMTYANIFFHIKNKSVINFQLGGKFATGKVNSEDSLPQAYMPGLGTNDIILGAGYTKNEFNIAAGYQKPFGRSANTVTRLKRGDDIFFMAGYTMSFKRISYKAEVLSIVELQPQSIQNQSGGFYTVSGSNQSQVNLMAQVTFNATDRTDIKLYTVVPLLQRDYNYDGLKRTFSAGLDINYIIGSEKK